MPGTNIVDVLVVVGFSFANEPINYLPFSFSHALALYLQVYLYLALRTCEPITVLLRGFVLISSQTMVKYKRVSCLSHPVTGAIMNIKW